MHGSPSEPIDPVLLRYERLQKEHLAVLTPIEHEAYPDPWTQGMFHQEIRNGTSHFYLAFDEDRLVAYGGFWMLLEEVHVTKITVAQPYRSQGIGRVFMQHLEQLGIQAGGTIMRLEVRESNVPARALYARLGYEEIGVRKNYYAATGEHAVVMAKNLVQHSEGAP